MATPLVTIIGLSYNQGPFIKEALDSVKAQTYPHLEVILVDDGSSDNSPELLREYAAANPDWKLLLLPENKGNTVAFNQALKLATGKYVIDFALDDVLLPGRVALQVSHFEQLPEDYGVLYTNAQLIDHTGSDLGMFCDDEPGQERTFHTGNVFTEILNSYFICTPTVLIRRQVLEELGGYDESLAYEDFDLFVRAARRWQFSFLNLPLTKKRVWQGSMSQSFYKRKRLPYFQSTLRVCQKAAKLVQTQEEKAALCARIRFEMRQAVFTEHPEVVPAYMQLLRELDQHKTTDTMLAFAAKLNLPLAGLFRFYHTLSRSKKVK